MALSPSVPLGILTVLTGIFLLDVMGVFIRILAETYPVQQLSALRNLFGMIPSFVLLATMPQWHRSGRPLRMRQWKLALLRGVFVTFAQLCFYLALTKLAFATVSTLAFVSPMIVTALSVPLLGERVGPWRWVAVLFGFGGVLMIMQPGADTFSIWALLPVGAAAGYATASVMVRLFEDDIPSPLVNLYSNLSAMTGAVILTLAMTNPIAIQSWPDLGLIIAMGLSGGTGVLCLTIAYRMVRPSVLAPFEYTGILFAFALGWLVFSEAPWDELFPGVLLIVGAGMLIIWRERRNKAEVPYPRSSRRNR